MCIGNDSHVNRIHFTIISLLLYHQPNIQQKCIHCILFRHHKFKSMLLLCVCACVLFCFSLLLFLLLFANVTTFLQSTVSIACRRRFYFPSVDICVNVCVSMPTSRNLICTFVELQKAK